MDEIIKEFQEFVFKKAEEIGSKVEKKVLLSYLELLGFSAFCATSNMELTEDELAYLGDVSIKMAQEVCLSVGLGERSWSMEEIVDSLDESSLENEDGKV